MNAILWNESHYSMLFHVRTQRDNRDGPVVFFGVDDSGIRLPREVRHDDDVASNEIAERHGGSSLTTPTL